jgi:hypothetical protein
VRLYLKSSAAVLIAILIQLRMVTLLDIRDDMELWARMTIAGEPSDSQRSQDFADQIRYRRYGPQPRDPAFIFQDSPADPPPATTPDVAVVTSSDLLDSPSDDL